MKNYCTSIFPRPAYNTPPPNKCEPAFSLKLNNEIHEYNTRSKHKIHITRTSESCTKMPQTKPPLLP